MFLSYSSLYTGLGTLGRDAIPSSGSRRYSPHLEPRSERSGNVQMIINLDQAGDAIGQHKQGGHIVLSLGNGIVVVYKK